jgi:hypothetical protein
MSNIAFPVAGRVTEAVGVTGNSGTSIDAGSAGVYGAWVSLGGSFPFDVDGFWYMGATDNNPAAQHLFCVAVGAGNDANMIVEDCMIAQAYYQGSQKVWCPVRVKAGKTIYVKCTQSYTKLAAVIGCAGNFPQPVGFSKMKGLGTASNVPFSLTTVADTTTTTWVEAVASTARRYSGLLAQIDATVVPSSGLFRWRIGIGASPSKLAGDFVSVRNANVHNIPSLIPVDIKAGSRLLVAANSGTAVTLYVNLCGLEA